MWLEGGFERGRLYQVAYTAVGAPVIGVSLAALRDCASWLKHGTAAEANPAAGALRWAYAYGRSQTGRLLRTLVHWDLNLDEQGREAFDGIIANVAGGMRGEFNQRFGQNSKDRPQMMAHVFPSTDVATTDRVTGKTDALHRGSTRGGAGSRSSTRTPRPSTTAATPRSCTPIPTASATWRTARTRASTTSPGPSTAWASGRPPTRPPSPPIPRAGSSARRTSAASSTTVACCAPAW